ncbi:hypothetical protein BDV26DRAFT_273272 [Aspergillus bertholletiae]|uniref:Uncharacterized protein n=1 Tax=Aspergillus bertholletiae TaxID=1226010 RepID=A0A5N7AVE1_9EURO|nr:hypothetical protein BDV26DRAFT_273272 [Aspergillus bertholletiae]
MIIYWFTKYRWRRLNSPKRGKHEKFWWDGWVYGILSSKKKMPTPEDDRSSIMILHLHLNRRLALSFFFYLSTLQAVRATYRVSSILFRETPL